jgi:hypothetical protein
VRGATHGQTKRMCAVRHPEAVCQLRWSRCESTVCGFTGGPCKLCIKVVSSGFRSVKPGQLRFVTYSFSHRCFIQEFTPQRATQGGHITV